MSTALPIYYCDEELWTTLVADQIFIFLYFFSALKLSTHVNIVLGNYEHGDTSLIYKHTHVRLIAFPRDLPR